MSVVRGIGKLVALAIFLIVAYVAWTFADVWYSARQDEAAPADAIVVLGAAQFNGRPSPVLAARLDHAVDLWQQGLAPTIVVTGGRIGDDTTSEAGASASYLARQGVPDGAVLREVQGRSSWESLQAAARFMKNRGIEEVILVSDPFHSARIEAMASDLELEPLVSPTRTSPLGGDALIPHYVKETASLAVGRIFGFSRLASLEQDFSARSQ